jgi:phosphatidylglycerophosphatase A
LTMVAAPAGWLWILLGFLLFRLFDILKPFPINWFDRHIKGGMGIMLDDALAGSFAWLVLQLLRLAMPSA